MEEYFIWVKKDSRFLVQIILVKNIPNLFKILDKIQALNYSRARKSIISIDLQEYEIIQTR